MSLDFGEVEVGKVRRTKCEERGVGRGTAFRVTLFYILVFTKVVLIEYLIDSFATDAAEYLICFEVVDGYAVVGAEVVAMVALDLGPLRG